MSDFTAACQSGAIFIRGLAQCTHSPQAAPVELQLSDQVQALLLELATEIESLSEPTEAMMATLSALADVLDDSSFRGVVGLIFVVGRAYERAMQVDAVE